MYKLTIEGPEINFSATGLGYGVTQEIIGKALQAQAPKRSRSEKAVSVPAAEPEPQSEPEPEPAEGGEPP